MKKAIVFAAVMVMLTLANDIEARISFLVNGSFEDDGYITDITVKEPNGWDVNVPTAQFSGWVSNSWFTDGSYSLTIYSYWYATFEANDIATVSQDVYLTLTKKN